MAPILRAIALCCATVPSTLAQSTTVPLSVPACAQTCANNAVASSGCNSADLTCICLSPDFAFPAVDCVQAACGPEEYVYATAYMSTICVAVTSLTLPTYTGTRAPTGSVTAATGNRSLATPSGLSSGTAGALTPESSDATSSTSQTSGSSSGLSTGAQAGIGVGVSLGGLLLLFGGFMLGRRWRMKVTFSRKDAAEAGAAARGESTAEKYEYGPVHEMSVSDTRAELEAARRNTRPPGELP